MPKGVGRMRITQALILYKTLCHPELGYIVIKIV